MNKKQYFLLTLVALITMIGGAAQAQCPAIDYTQRSHDYLITRNYLDGPTGSQWTTTPNPRTGLTEPAMVRCYWDTAVDCANTTVTIKCSTYVGVGRFERYNVTSIPYNPPDASFNSTAGGGAKIVLSSDDGWQPSVALQHLPFTFSFFGQEFNDALVSPNGTIKFGTASELNAINGGHDWHAANWPIPTDGNNLSKSLLGCFCDIYPASVNNDPTKGVFRSVYGEYPCRKLVVSEKQTPKYGYSNGSKYTTFQMVCYEGTNIIEVHIQHHNPEENASTHCQTVGINWGATTAGLDESAILGGCQPAYPIPVGTAGMRCDQVLTNEAWRWTPVGPTMRNVQWYYGTDTSAMNGRKINATEGDSIIMRRDVDPGDDTTLTVRPTIPTTYTARMLYIGAGGYRYDLVTYITVGVNYDSIMSFEGDTILCRGESTVLRITQGETAMTRPGNTTWSIISNDPGGTYAQNLRLHNLNETNATSIEIPTYFSANIFNAYPDSDEIILSIEVSTDFTNGCNNSVVMNVHFINNAPHLGDTLVAHTCEGNPYTWTGGTGDQYTEPGSFPYTFDTVYLHDENYGHCQKTRMLRLNIEPNKDTLYNIKDCKPFYWDVNGETYEETTSDRVDNLQTIWGCDSIIRLNYVRDQGLTAIINAVPGHATLDQLHIQLKDMSLGSDARKWWFPDMGDREDTIVTVYFDFPTELDSVTVFLDAMRNYPEFGSTCHDTTYITIPLLKEAIWFPNAFTPDRDVNNVWRVFGTGIVELEVEIYDRQGTLVYTYQGIENGWNGTALNGQELPSGTYVFRARYSNVLDPSNPLSHKGSIILIR